MKETNLVNELTCLLAPFIKQMVLETIEEQRAQQPQVVEDAEVTVNQAARQLHVTKVTLWRWEKSEYLTPVRIGSKVYYRQSDIDRLKQGRN